MTDQLFFHKLVSPTCNEVVFAHFQNPEASRLLGLTLEVEGASEPTTQHMWNCTRISAVPHGNDGAVLRVTVPFGRSIDGFVRLIGALTIGRECKLNVLAVIGDDRIFLSQGTEGRGNRMEIGADLAPIVKSAAVPKCFELEIVVESGEPVTVLLHWLGLAAERPISASSVLRRSEMSYFFNESLDLSRPRFAKKLLFDERVLDDVRAKLAHPVWNAHFGYMEAFAQACLARDPVADVGPYLPGYDERFVREHETGRPAYHWEALILAFVGLVKRDEALIRHAQRYLLCILDTTSWFSSAEETISTSSWDARSFLPELTTTSLALLWDWLDFTFKPHLRTAVARSLWRKGMAPVQGDLLKFEYMRNMNQGAVFCRALVLGGLMLEGQWDTKQFVDHWYHQLIDIAGRIVQKDGAYQEGPAYLCQFAHGVLPAMIAWSRLRQKDWRRDVVSHFGRTLRYLETMSQQVPGTYTPMGNSRIEECGGDLLPVLASLMPRDRFVHSVVGGALNSGAVFRASGTLRNSGGILALVYGPPTVEVHAKARRPALSILKSSHKARSTRKLGSHEVSILLNGPNIGLTHSHEDAGSVIVEVDDKIVFSDPGMIQYGFAETALLQRPENHNILIPLDSRGMPVSTQGVGESRRRVDCRRFGSARSFKASVDLDGVWKGLRSYTRRVASPSPSELTIIDVGQSELPRKFLFCLVTHFPAEVTGHSVVVDFGIGRAVVKGAWARAVEISRGPDDFRGRALARITLASDEVSAFDFSTSVHIDVVR